MTLETKQKVLIIGRGRKNERSKKFNQKVSKKVMEGGEPGGGNRRDGGGVSLVDMSACRHGFS